MAPSGSSNSTTTTFATMAPQLNNNNMTQTTGTTGNAFESYQLLAVGTSDRNIRVPVPLPMSQLPYRKAMVADLFFGTIKGLALDSAFSSADRIATTAGHFGFNTSSAEDEATVVSTKVRAAIFNVEHLTGLGFRNRKGDTVLFDPTGVRPKDIRYFAFRSVFTASAIDSRGPDTPLFWNLCFGCHRR